MLKRIIVLGLSLCAAASVFPVLATDQGARLDTRQIILRLKDDGVRHIQAVRSSEVVPGITMPDGRPLTLVRQFDGNGLVLRLPEAVSLQEAQAIAARLVADSSVISAQADKRMYPTLEPSDPGYLPGDVLPPDNILSGQWNLFEDAGGIRMETAWDRETGSPAGIIAQLDTGIIQHRDLDRDRILDGYDFITDIATANDGDARDPDPADPGDATVADECEPGLPGTNSSWHGLSVASIMVAKSNNIFDIAGIDFAASLQPVRVLGKCGGSVSDVADALRWAAGLSVAGVPENPAPARVINMSLSGAGNCTQEEQNAINAAVDAGAVVIVSAGNEDVDVATQSPANCQNVVTVGATLRDGSRAPYTNSGDEVDLSAPGGQTSNSDPNDPDGLNDPRGILVLTNSGTINADLLGGTTRRIAGSSFSTSQVSAVASLILAVNSSLSSGQVREILRRTTRAFPDASCNTNTCGSGILDADAALAGAADPTSVLGSRANLGGGGGGCAFAATAASGFDPLFLLLVILVARRCWQKRMYVFPPAR
jgi:serine protease